LRAIGILRSWLLGWLVPSASPEVGCVPHVDDDRVNADGR